MIDGKEFSTMNILKAHFDKCHKEDAMEWFEEMHMVILLHRFSMPMLLARIVLMSLCFVCVCVCLCLCL